jgi:hypothetical protein
MDLFRGINSFKKSCQPRSSVVKDEKCDLVRDSHNILDVEKTFLLAMECTVA